MAYATAGDLAVYITAAWLEGVDPAVVEQHLTDASDIADSYLGQRYTVPLLTYGRALVSHVCKIARWQICLHEGVGSESERGLYEADSEKAIFWLRDVVANKASVPGVETTQSPSDVEPESGPFGVLTEKPRGW